MAIFSAGTGTNGQGVGISPQNLPYHAQSTEGCLLNLESSLQGLTSEAVAARQQQAGQEKLDDDKPPAAREVFLNSYKKWVSLLFIGAALMSFVMGQPVDGILITVAMLVNGGVQGLIHWRSLKNQKSSLETSAIRCTVRRDGQTQMVSAEELVVGDVLVIQGGQVMPADARMLSSTQIQVDEAVLTGESVLVPKNANAILHPAEEVADQSNMLFAGTVVKTGKGEAVITALGRQTVMGKISALARNTEKRQSPFTRRLNTLSMRVFILAGILIAVVIGVGLYRGMPIPQLIQIGLVMAISAFPETIPGLASLILSMGIGRLNEKKVLIKSFQALEAIGDVTTICTDKTGTLTENYLSFDQLFIPEMGVIPYNAKWQQGEEIPSPSVEELLRIGRLNNGTVVDGLRSPLMGDPIDVALYRSAPASLESGYHPRVSIPFDPVKLRSATLCETPAGCTVSMIKGAPEVIMEMCSYYMRPDGTIAPISITQRSEFLMFNRKLAYEENLRVIGFAEKLMSSESDTDPYNGAVFMGWVALLDPAKPGVVEAIDYLYRTGSRLIMITGDQKPTAEMTARELGIMRRNADEVWLHSDLLSNEQGIIRDTVRVFARTRPEEKLTIVEHLQKSGQVVAMVGDGVNDSPALQRSDVAIAMGLQGSDAAKESADIILLNDRLEGVVHAILESRVIRRKIQSCIRYLLSCNLGLLFFVTATAIAGIFGAGLKLQMEMPLNVVQMLWLNLVITLVPALVLAIEPVNETELLPAAPEPEEADHPVSFIEKYKQKEEKEPAKIDPLDESRVFLMGYWAFMMMLAGLGAYFATLLLFKQPLMAGTASFLALALAQTFNLFNIQALNAGEDRRSFMSELASTPITWVVVLVALVMQALTIYLPFLNELMGTVALPWTVASVAGVLGGGSILFSLKTMNV
jgi:Ca2+-transporting ATPase